MRTRERAVALIGMALAAAVLSAPVGAQGRWSEGPEYTVVAAPGALDARVVGSWDLWISGTIGYETDGRVVRQRYTPGTGRGRLVIDAAGRWSWDGGAGRLVEVRPYYALDHLRYWLIRDRTGEYVVTYDERGGKPFRLLYTGGGILATGERRGGGGATPGAGSGGGVDLRGDAISPTWIQEAGVPSSGQTRCGERSATRCGSEAAVPQPAPKPAATPTPAQGSGANPLGVEWVGGSATRPAAPPAGSAAGSNPLGVEWVGTGSATRPAAPPAGSASGSNPLGVEWVGGGATKPATPPAPVAPVTPPKPETPVTGGAPVRPAPEEARVSAAELAGIWRYRSTTFGPGTDGTMAVSGVLVLRPDGTYEQELRIGEFVQPYRGRWTLDGRTVTVQNAAHTQRWGVAVADDRLDVELLGLATPMHYVLERVERCAPGARCEGR